MKKLLLLLSAIAFISHFQAQTTTSFRMNYGVALMDIPANAIESQTSGKYVFAGMNVNFLPIVGTVTELNSDGTLSWTKQYSGGLSYQLNDIKKDVGSGYYLCGGSSSSSGVFLRIDNNGNYVDGNRFDLNNSDGDYLSRMIKTSDGGYVAAGYSYGYDPDGAGGLPKNDSTSAMVVKFDANGNVLWHHVFRFYSDAGKTNPILNDGAFSDVIEVSDGYIFVGSYEVDDVINVDSDGDDQTPNDAIILKTTTAGAITYFKQIDTPSTSSSQASRDLTSISKTAAGLPLISGTDGTGRPALVMRLPGSGGWVVPTWIRKYGATQFFGIYDPFIPSRFFETSDGNYAMMGMYIQPLGAWTQFLMKINPATYTPVFSKSYAFSLAVILPHGQQVSDNGFISVSTVMNGGGFDYHVIKTDPNGVAPAACAETNISPSNATVSYTWADPFYNDYNANVYDNSTITPTITPISPASSVQCLTVVAPCTPPAAATTTTATPSTICVGQSSTLTASGPASNVTYNVYTASTGGTNLGATPLVVSPTTTTTYYIETVDNTNPSCVSVTRTPVTVTVSPTPTAPGIGTITQPTCTVSTGSVALTGLPASGTWTVTASPGGATITGTGTTATFSGLAPGTYTFTVSNSSGSTTIFSETFESGGTGWTLNVPTGAEGSDPNFFIVNDNEGGVAPPGCGVATNGNKTLHITSAWNPSGGAAYDAGGLCGFLFCPQTNRRAESPIINTVGQSGLTLNFKYIANGQSGQDFASVWYNDGTGWYQLGAALSAPVCGSGQGQWSNYTSALPASCNNIANLRIAIKWQNNDDGVGTDPSVAINDITITAPGSGCTSPASLTATINPQPSVPTAPIVGTVTQPTCATPTGSVALSGLPASGTWTITGSPSGSGTGTGTTTTITGLTPGASYTFTVTNAGGCTSTASTATGMINAAPTVPTAPIVGTITQPTCATPTGSVALSGLPASGSWTITGSPSGSATGSGTTTTISGLNPGTSYTFTVTNASGCTSSASTSAAINTVPGAPSAPVIGTITQPTCTVATGSISLSGLPASGTWTITGSPSGSATGTGTTTTISGLGAGSYTFTVTNDLGCTSAASTAGVINAQPSTPTAPIVGTVTQPDCATATGSVDLSGLPASGTWTITGSPSGSATGTGTTTTITGLTPGSSYTFTVTNAGGCTSTASTATGMINAAPTVPTAPIVGTITQPTCATPTGSVDLSGLPASGSWTITGSPSGSATGSGTTTTISGLNPGASYTFTVTNASGCTSSASTAAAINTVPGAPSAPVIGTITQPTCTVATGSIALSGLPASGTWTITGSPSGSATGTGTTTTITGLGAGSYTFTVTNDLGCTSAASSAGVINAQPSTPTAPIVGTVTQPDCATATGSVDLSGLPASGTWTITGSPSGSATGTGTTTTITGLTPGTSYTFTVTNTDGCVSTSSTATATINAQPSTPTTPIVGTVTQPTCTSPTGSVDLSGLPSSGTWTITASPGGATQTGTGTTATFTGLNAGTSYTFTITNASGCTSTASSSVVINSVPGAPTAPTAGTVTQPTCATPTGSFDVTSPLGAQYTYSIDGTNFQASTNFSGLTPGNYTITVLDNTSGCSSNSATPVTIDPVAGAPTVSLVTSNDVSCNGLADGSLEISVTGGSSPYTYSWTPNVGSGPTLTNLAAGSYSVTVTDNVGCSATASYSINAPAAIAVNGVSSNVICGSSDGSITTSASGGTSPYTYDWTPNGETSSSINGLAAGSYGVSVTDDNGCTATQSFTITLTGSLPIAVNPDYYEINEGESVVLTATGGTNYTWTPPTGLSCTDCPNPTASPTATTTYYVTSTDPNGCTGGDSAVVVIKLPCGDLFVPTIFSPNGTGPDANNELCVFGTPQCIEKLLFQVYDRWGEKVFETEDITKCWDGNYKDKPMNSGIYVYRLYVKLFNNDEPIDVSGNTTLVR